MKKPGGGGIIPPKGGNTMKYRVKACDLVKDELITMEVEAPCVFDVIDYVASHVGNPEETELIEAMPICDE